MHLKPSHTCVCMKLFAQHTNGVGGSFGSEDPPTLVSNSLRGLLTECPGLLEGPGAQAGEGETSADKGGAKSSRAGPHPLAGPSVADRGECWGEGEKERMTLSWGHL